MDKEVAELLKMVIRQNQYILELNRIIVDKLAYLRVVVPKCKAE